MIYLDYNATTPVDPSVAEAMMPFLTGFYGNPSSIHEEGVKARKAVENARVQLAAVIGCHSDEIIFTSGGSEANNLAIKGIAHALRNKGNHIITSCIEHPAVTEVCRHLEKEGFKITYLPVDQDGLVNPEDVKRNITSSTILVTIMHANNETGSVQPVSEIGRITHEQGVAFHTDAAQSIGKIQVNVDEMNVDMLSVAGHKFYAPKGVGALYIRRGITIEKLIHGADHEHNLRAGTENVMSVAGLGKAAAVAAEYLETPGKMAFLRDLLYDEIKKEIPEVKMNGHPVKRLPNTLSLSFPGVEAALLLSKMENVAASAGAACHSGSEVVSPVLKAMGVDDHFAMGTIRFSVGRMTTEDEIRLAVPEIVKAYRDLKGENTVNSISEKKIKLTHYTHSLGCACKINPAYLSEILKMIPGTDNPDVLVGFETSDDAAVYKIGDDKAVVLTIDLIPPVVDDPYDFGAVAAANALSDVYAMGAEPLFALSIVGFPRILPSPVLQEIIKGANDKVSEAEISVIGGHSIEDTEPKFGLVVTGIIHPEKILRNSGAKPGDKILLTKPIGSGIISTAVKRGAAAPDSEKAMIRNMSELNRKAAEIMRNFPVSACTDVTGFGLSGHLMEMVKGSGCSAEISFSSVPLLPGVTELAGEGIIPGGTVNNFKYVENDIEIDPGLASCAGLVLSDAQTSGGLLISVPADHAEELLKELRDKGVPEAAIIGSFRNDISCRIRISK